MYLSLFLGICFGFCLDWGCGAGPGLGCVRWDEKGRRCGFLPSLKLHCKSCFSPSQITGKQKWLYLTLWSYLTSHPSFKVRTVVPLAANDVFFPLSAPTPKLVFKVFLYLLGDSRWLSFSGVVLCWQLFWSSEISAGMKKTAPFIYMTQEGERV